MSFLKKIKAFLYCIREAFQTNKTRYFNDRSAWGHIGAHSVVHSPNIVSGRAGHYMKYKDNGELKGYLSWFTSTNII